MEWAGVVLEYPITIHTEHTHIINNMLNHLSITSVSSHLILVSSLVTDQTKLPLCYIPYLE